MADRRSTWQALPDDPSVSVRYRTDSRTGRVMVCGIRIERDTIGANDLRSIPVGHLETVANVGGQLDGDLPPLRRPDGLDPAGFYRLLAAHYRVVVVRTAAPAPVLAEAAGVPTATVHRWIAEARRRGFLPAARKGRAG